MQTKSILTLFSLLLLLGCNSDRTPRPDVSDIEIDLTIQRFDRAITDDTGADAGAMKEVVQAFPAFAPVYFQNVIPIDRPDLNAEDQEAAFQSYRDYPLLATVDSLVRDRFTDERIEVLTEEFTQSLKFYRYYLPDAPLPDTLTTFISTFELVAFLYGNDDLAVGLDFFLGPDFNYQQVASQESIFSNYLAVAYTPDHFTEKLLRLLLDDYQPAPRSGRLIDYILYEGKKLYLLSLLLPDTDPHIYFEVTPDQMDWLLGNEVQLYAHLQKEDILYDTNPKLIRNYTQPGPFSQGMPRESPGGAVNYLGYRIVQSYLAANPKVTIPELLAETDGQLLLSGARYKPRK